MKDYLFRGSVGDLDPAVSKLIELEATRQYRKLILIPSESQAPAAVREAAGSVFQNLYAEGYPADETRLMDEDEIMDYTAGLLSFRRFSDKRYYKGVEYADFIEALARRRCAELFAANGKSPDNIFVNVQPLSGAAANNAVYHALVKPGETIMGMDLLHGGHLSHGSPVNRSGKYYNAVHYTVDAQTEQINYDAVEALAMQTKPRFIIAGYSSYPWAVDWQRFRKICDLSGALLFADIAHVAGLVAAGVYPSPVGYADIVTFTTHKSLCGPRGACILTFDSKISRDIDRAVFPGEQGGPHVNAYTAMAVAFKLAGSEQFANLQRQVVKNCAVLADQLAKRGFTIPYGGTNTHLMNLSLNSIVGEDGTKLSGEMAARLLDSAGIVVNRNTIPGDVSAAETSGLRMGTPWITQRGLSEAEVAQLADVIADVLLAAKPFGRSSFTGKVRRTKVDFNVLEDAKLKVRRLAETAGIDFDPIPAEYPHFFYIDAKPAQSGRAALEVSGPEVRLFLNYALTNDLEALQAGESQPTCLYTPQGAVDCTLTCLGTSTFRLSLPAEQYGLASAWLRDLAESYVQFDGDVQRELPGLVEVHDSVAEPASAMAGEALSASKPYTIGMPDQPGEALPRFEWVAKEETLRRTPVYETHKKLGAKIIPFAGWEMPVWYTSVMEEHLAVRQAAGVFDVAHMGVYQVEGVDAASFLNCVIGNDASGLLVGESLYSQFLDPDAQVIDDLLVYRRGDEKFLVVVNASNDDKDWAWLNAVKNGEVQIDRQRPWVKATGRRAVLRNLRDPKEEADMRVDIALQGPRSRDVLLAMGVDGQTKARIMKLQRTQLCEGVVGGFDLIISRTGYTGERMAFELFVHPDRAEALFNAILAAGAPMGVKPIGLGARDSLRTEAGLPLYGNEMGGELSLGVAEAGFGSYVRTRKPWFIGRQAYIEREKTRKGDLVRFRFTEKGVRMAHHGDPLLDKRGRVVGTVTSCAVDSEGYLTGQAYVETKSAELDTLLSIYQGASKNAVKAPGDLIPGDRVVLPTLVKVLSRFPKAK